MTENPRVYPFQRDGAYFFISYDHPERGVSWAGSPVENVRIGNQWSRKYSFFEWDELLSNKGHMVMANKEMGKWVTPIEHDDLYWAVPF